MLTGRVALCAWAELKKFLKKNCEEETLAVADPKLGNLIKEKLDIPCVHSQGVMELLRGVRQQMAELVSHLASSEVSPMALGLSHSLSRYKLKFSPDKVDTMIVQAIGLLDDLDKELNTYAMRVREWYGWHFPEMTKIVTDNIAYAKCVKFMGLREKAAALDFSGIPLDEATEQELKDAAVVSMGTDVSDDDMMYISNLADQVCMCMCICVCTAQRSTQRFRRQWAGDRGETGERGRQSARREYKVGVAGKAYVYRGRLRTSERVAAGKRKESRLG